jgi:hypothetical protein
MEELLRGLGLLLMGMGLTFLVSMVVGRLASRRGMALWVWHRSGSIGRVMIVVGFGLAVIGLGQGGSSGGGASLMVLGALIGMAGIWLIMPGP